jgi:hypothetical protein
VKILKLPNAGWIQSSQSEDLLLRWKGVNIKQCTDLDLELVICTKRSILEQKIINDETPDKCTKRKSSSVDSPSPSSVDPTRRAPASLSRLGFSFSACFSLALCFSQFRLLHTFTSATGSSRLLSCSLRCHQRPFRSSDHCLLLH